MSEQDKGIARIAEEVTLDLLLERCPNGDNDVINRMLKFVSKVKVEAPIDEKRVHKALRTAGKQWLKERGLWQTRERDRLAPLGLHASAKDESADLDPESNDDQTSQQLTELARDCADECGAFGMTESAAIRRDRERAKDNVESLMEKTSPETRSKLKGILDNGGPASLRATADEIGLKHPEELRRFYRAVAKESRPTWRVKASRSPRLGKSGPAAPYEPAVVSREVIMSTPGAPCLTYWKDLRTSASRGKRTLKAKAAPNIYDLPVPRRAHKVTHRQFGHGVVLQIRDTDSGKAVIVQFDNGSRRIVLCGEDYFDDPLG